MTEVELRELVEKVEKGETAAEEQLARHFLKPIYTVATHYRFAHEDALEIVQETLDAVFTKLRNHKFRGESTLSTFVYQICKHQCTNYLKKSKRLKRGGAVKLVPFDESVIHMLPADPLGSDPLEVLKDQEINDIVDQCIEALNEEYRTIFKLLLDNHRRDEISKMLKIPIERYDSITCYGRKKLKKCIEQKFR